MGEVEDELQRLCRKLGGGWRIERGIMPVVVMTIIEAQNLEKRLDGDKEQWEVYCIDWKEPNMVAGPFDDEDAAKRAADGFDALALRCSIRRVVTHEQQPNT